MSPASAVPAMRLALLALLQTALGDENISVDLDPPMVNGAFDFVFVGDVTNEVTALAMTGDLGPGSTQETFVVEVVCEAYRGGDNAAATFARAAQLADTVMAQVRTYPNLGGVNFVSRPIGVQYESEIATGDAGGRITRATVSIRCSGSL